ncbi:hypothetical protein H257_06483 [Aphanomyces astaci]|uniref:CRAL-TRIO domain-containing protein n=1 Tax=Aphanomyces astaci TaxID=112090 RepID=W4GL74_APHAT|nr:hypothetical protein H257_06483 [Aphanomyces astaci]ETV80086.1 hypothetical protein H257_06483 [Aphanomyces astaci]|eukprot:XP_009830010.1 hypothetical protein H257_06483 [Aphanomyces astaci]
MQDKRRATSDTSSSPGSLMGTRDVAIDRTLSSTSALPTPRGIGSTLNVCVEGKFLGILMSGMVEKRREGAVRAGFARRLFLLSVRGCHYYRKADDAEVFGTERGHLALRDFGYAKIVPENEAPYGTVEPSVDGYHFVGLFSKQHTLTWFLRVDSMDVAKAWVTAIGAAQEIAKKHLYPTEWTSTMYNTFSSILTGHALLPAPANETGSTSATPSNHDSESPSSSSLPALEVASILAVSIEQPSQQHDMTQHLRRERLVSRKVHLNQPISVGTSLLLNESLTILLSNGQSVSLSLETVRHAAPTSSLSTTLPIDLATSSFRIQASLHLTKSASPPTTVPSTPLSPSSSSLHTSSHELLQAPYNAAALAFSGLYIVSCVLAYAFGPPFQGLMQITVILGAFLSLSVVASAGLRVHEIASIKAGQTRAATSTNSGPSVGSYAATLTITALDRVAPAPEEQTPGEKTTTTSETAPKAVPELAFSPRFIAAEKGNVDKGRVRYENTLQWRRENRVDGMLHIPQPHFHLIKKNYPQYFHGQSIKGHCVYYEKVGKIDLKAMKAAGLTIEQLLRHYIYLTEYMWTILEPSDSGRSVTVLDVEGIGFYDLTGDVMDFVRQAMGFVSAHYPERSAQIFIVNVPRWFDVVWRVVSPMIEPVTKEKIRICKGRAVKEELLKSIAEDQLPVDYGGTGVKLGLSAEEVALAKHVDDIMEKSGKVDD